jgi:hypothetical protein
LTYFGEPTGQGGCQFSVARNRKGDKLRECSRFQPVEESRAVVENSHESLSSFVWAKAWDELYKVYSERLDQENVDLMDSIFSAVVAELEMVRETAKSQEIKRCGVKR